MILSRIAAASVAHKRVVLATWLVVLVAGFVAVPSLFGRLVSEAGHIDQSEAGRAEKLLDEATPGGERIFAIADGRDVDDLRGSVERVAAEVRALPGVAQVATPWSDGTATSAQPNPDAVARDGKAVAIAVQFAPPRRGEHAIDRATERLRSIDAPRVMVGGGPLQDDEMDSQAGEDLARAEMISMPIVLIVLVVVMGGFIAAGLPVLVSVLGVATTLGVLAVASMVTDVSVYAINIVTMLGLGLAVDYGLLIVARFREERRVDAGNPGSSDSADVTGAVMRSMATAGRTVTFSGLTVATSLAGLLVFPDPFLRSAGLAGIIVVLLELAMALTVLPALLAKVGHRIRPAKEVPADRGLFVRLTRLVSRRPVVVIAATVSVLLLAAVPFLGVRFADPDARSLPADSQSRQLAETATARFPAGADVDPITIVSTDGATPAELDRYVATLKSLDDVRDASVRPDTGDLTVIDVAPEGESQGEQALDLVGTVRDTAAPMDIQVTGDAAQITDYKAALADRAPLALGIVALATFVLLFLFTGSVVVPIKALVMNTLSLGASFGALVWVFQDGHLGGLVGTEALGSLSVTTPVLMFAIAFGLSMDYEVFLLGRIAESYRRTGDNLGAVATGLQRTGRIVTAAAVLMGIVFAGFVAGGFSPVKQVGLGLALAVLVDATIVRMLLVPAVMSLMGRANWWAPGPLRRLHHRIGLTDAVGAPAHVRSVCTAR